MRTTDVPLGHLAQPDAGTHPGIVIVHDVWGNTELYRGFARRLAGEGFAALALDLYRREVNITDPGAWMRDLSDPAVVGDVQAGVDLLAAHPAVGGRAVGVTGFCMGGTYALLAASGCRGIAACVAFYGILSHAHGILSAPGGLDPAKKPRDPLRAAADLRVPTLAIYGDQDEFVPADDVKQLEQRFAALSGRTGVAAEVRVYPGCGHAFLNETRPQAFRPEAAADAWARMVAWFRAHLA